MQSLPAFILQAIAEIIAIGLFVAGAAVAALTMYP